MNKYPLIRRIYLYLFAFIGLVLITIGCVRLVGLGLKTYIFKQADIYYNYPPPRSVVMENQKEVIEQEPSKEEIEAFEKKQRKANREREAAESIAMIIVGVPLYLYHWRVIKRDKEKEEPDA